MPDYEYLAPIVLFVYNRPDHTCRTIAALAANMLAKESELFIFSDAPKNDAATEAVQSVRSFIDGIQGFKNVTVTERGTNWGLAKSIISGVTEIVNRYGKVIVLEDDIVTSPYFLTYMNGALDYYKDNKKVWHISGWNSPINPDGLDNAFFWHGMDCWGWATWQNRWKNFTKDADLLLSQFTKYDIFRFNHNNSADMWGQVLANKAKK
jgi:GT2 family glycosyltransferase